MSHANATKWTERFEKALRAIALNRGDRSEMLKSIKEALGTDSKFKCSELSKSLDTVTNEYATKEKVAEYLRDLAVMDLAQHLGTLAEQFRVLQSLREQAFAFEAQLLALEVADEARHATLAARRDLAKLTARAESQTAGEAPEDHEAAADLLVMSSELIAQSLLDLQSQPGNALNLCERLVEARNAYADAVAWAMARVVAATAALKVNFEPDKSVLSSAKAVWDAIKGAKSALRPLDVYVRKTQALVQQIVANERVMTLQGYMKVMIKLVGGSNEEKEKEFERIEQLLKNPKRDDPTDFEFTLGPLLAAEGLDLTKSRVRLLSLTAVPVIGTPKFPNSNDDRNYWGPFVREWETSVRKAVVRSELLVPALTLETGLDDFSKITISETTVELPFHRPRLLDDDFVDLRYPEVPALLHRPLELAAMEEAWRLRYNAFAIRRSHRAERFANMFDFAGFLGKKSVGPPSSSYPSVGLLNIAVSAVVAIQPRGGQPTKVAAKATGARKKAASSTKAKGAR